MKLIVFVGPKGSGKDTCANILSKDKKICHRKISFALPLKRICSEVFDISMQSLGDPVLKERDLKEPLHLTTKHIRKIRNLMLTYVDPYEPGCYYNANKITDVLVGTKFTTPRSIMQIIGTELIKNQIETNWHCWAAFGKKNQTILGIPKNSVAAVTDCRFVNEYNYLKNKFQNNILFYYVERPEAEEVLSKATHASELSVLEVRKLLEKDGGKIIENYGNLGDLEELLKGIEIPYYSEEELIDNTTISVPGSKFKWGRR